MFYFTEATLGAVRIDDYKYRFIDQPGGWLGGTVKVDWPILTNIRLDPFERTGMPSGANGSMNYTDWFVYEFWRFVFVQQVVAKFAQSFDRVPADAEGRKLQPGGREGADPQRHQVALRAIGTCAKQASQVCGACSRPALCGATARC